MREILVSEWATVSGGGPEEDKIYRNGTVTGCAQPGEYPPDCTGFFQNYLGGAFDNPGNLFGNLFDNAGYAALDAFRYVEHHASNTYDVLTSAADYFLHLHYDAWYDPWKPSAAGGGGGGANKAAQLTSQIVDSSGGGGGSSWDWFFGEEIGY